MKHIEFRNVLALIMVLCSFAFLFMMLYIKVPKENEALINVVAGAVLVGGVGAVIGYFFGSSKAQHDNQLGGGAGSPENPIAVDATITEKKPISYTFGDITITPEEYGALPEEDKKNYTTKYD